MKNKSLLPILLLAALTLGACNLPGSGDSSKKESSVAQVSSEDIVASSEEQPISSEEQPVSSEEQGSSEEPVEYGVEIANKAALQGEWYAGTTRDLDVTLSPAANPLAELNKNLTVTSSDPEVVAVTGLGLSALKAGTATITVKYHDATDTVDVTILDNSAKAKYGVAHEGTAADPFTNEDALAVAKSEKYEGEVYYVKGKVASFYNAPGSRTDGMVAYFLEPATAGGEKFEIYKCFKEDGSALTDDDIWVGGEATAYGAFTKYNSQYETSSAIFVSCEGNKPQARQTLTKTFAETLALGAALADGADSYDYIKFQGYVTKKSGNNYFLTATKGEEIVSGKSDEAHGSRDIYTNAIELYNAGTVAELVAKLLEDAKVEVTMVVKNYHGTVENGLNLTNDDVTVVEAGHEWVIPATKATVAQAIEVINGLEDGKTTDTVYEITGFITAVTTAWSAQYKNITYTIGDAVDAAASAVITVFRSKAAEGTDGSALKAGDKVKVVGNLQKFVKDGAMTPELTNGETTLVEAGADLPVDITDVNAEAVAKTVAEIRAYQAADTTVFAQVTGVAENKYGNAQYGNFHLADPATGEEITIYGGYTDATFTKTGVNYATKTKTTAVTADIIGKTVTVYGTVGAYNKVGQLVDALVVVGDACTANVAASVAVNDASMGSATLSATTAAYGSDITVNITPASGYQVAKVEVQRASMKEEITAAEGVYKFKAQAKNAVTVTFEEIPAAGVEKATLKYNGTENKTGADYTGDALAEILNLDKNIFSVTYQKGGANELALRTDGIRMYGLKQTANGNKITVRAASGYNIKSIKVEFDSDSYAECAAIFAGATQVTGEAGAYTIDNSEFTILDDNTTKTSNTQVRFQSIEIVYEEGGAAQQEVAQPVGSFSGYAINASDDSNIFVDIALADSKAFVEVGSLLKTTVDFAFDKTTGLLTIALGGNFGNLTATYDETNNKLTNVAVDGAAAAMLKNNGSLELVAATKFWDCNGSTADLQATFKRRYMSGSWQVDNSNADRFVSSENGICGSAVQRRGYSGGAVALNLAADMTPVEVSNIGFWVYNPGSTDLTLRMWIYKGAGLTNNAELGSVTAVAGQWTYCRMGFTKASIYNFQIADFNNSGVALVFDNIVLF